MQEQEYKARDKIVRKMNRDGLTEENLQNGETVRVSQREREERIVPKQEEDVSFSRSDKDPDHLKKRGETQTETKGSAGDEARGGSFWFRWSEHRGFGPSRF